MGILFVLRVFFFGARYYFEFVRLIVWVIKFLGVKLVEGWGENIDLDLSRKWNSRSSIYWGF